MAADGSTLLADHVEPQSFWLEVEDPPPAAQVLARHGQDVPPAGRAAAPAQQRLGHGQDAFLGPVSPHWTALPERPQPSTARRCEEWSGRAVVLGATAAFLAAGNSAALLGELEPSLQQILMTALWVEAVVAVVCLVGVQSRDPGVIQRSEQRCLPVPAGPVNIALLAGLPLEVSRPESCSTLRTACGTSTIPAPTASTACAAWCGAAGRRRRTTAPSAKGASATSTTTVACSVGA